jgi:hypothetical protein
MRRSSHIAQTLALGGALTGVAMSAVPVSAQRLPIVVTTAPVVVGVAVPPAIVLIPPFIPGGDLHGGPWLSSGRADVAVDIDRSRERGQIVVR